MSKFFIVFQLHRVSTLATTFFETGKASSDGVRVYFSFNRTGKEYVAQHWYTLRIIGLCTSTLHLSQVDSSPHFLSIEPFHHRVFRRSFILQEQLKEAVKTIVDLAKQPFYALRDAISKVIKTIKAVVKKIKQTLIAIKRVVLSIRKYKLNTFDMYRTFYTLHSLFRVSFDSSQSYHFGIPMVGKCDKYMQQEIGHTFRQVSGRFRGSGGRLQSKVRPNFRISLQHNIRGQHSVLHSEAARLHLHACFLYRRHCGWRCKAQ